MIVSSRMYRKWVKGKMENANSRDRVLIRHAENLSIRVQKRCKGKKKYDAKNFERFREGHKKSARKWYKKIKKLKLENKNGFRIR